MKINPVNTFTTAIPKTFKRKENSENPIITNNLAHSLVTPNASYNRMMITSGINFRGVQSSTQEIFKQIPLEDRLASLFEILKPGDLILTAPKIADAKKGIMDTLSVIKNVIKRAFFVEDENIEGALGFLRNNIGDLEVLNINEFPITLTAGNKSDKLDAHDNFYILKDDVLKIKDTSLTIKDKPKVDLSAYRRHFAKAFDFEKLVEPEIEKINKKSMSTISQEAKKNGSAVTFAQVGGQKDLIDTLKKSIIYPIRYPQSYKNIDVNHGFILYGPPGTGKTHIARALANEAGANFISLNGLELESKWVGESESNWRQLFSDAKDKQPSIIFIDEFDSVARSRDSHDEYGNKVVNQLLTLMSDIDNEADDVFVIGATNNFKALDSAITRSGRFSKHLKVDLPDREGIKQIFDIHSANKPLDEAIDKEALFDKFLSMKLSGADIRYLINEAHSNGYERAGIFEKMDKQTLKNNDLEEFRITQEDFDKAIEAFNNEKTSPQRKTIGFVNK